MVSNAPETRSPKQQAVEKTKPKVASDVKQNLKLLEDYKKSVKSGKPMPGVLFGGSVDAKKKVASKKKEEEIEEDEYDEVILSEEEPEVAPSKKSKTKAAASSSSKKEEPKKKVKEEVKAKAPQKSTKKVVEQESESEAEPEVDEEIENISEEAEFMDSIRKQLEEKISANLAEDKVEVYDLSGANMSSAQLEVVQGSIDKLNRKYDGIARTLKQLDEHFRTISSPMLMMAEDYVNQKVPNILRLYNLVASDLKVQPFLKVNNENRIKEYVRQFVHTSGVPGADEVVIKTVPNQKYIDIDGLMREHSGFSTSELWITGPMGIAKGGRQSSVVSGTSCVTASLHNIASSIHQALVLPSLVRRYTSRVLRITQKSTLPDSIDQAEKVTCFVVIGSYPQRTPKSHANVQKEEASENSSGASTAPTKATTEELDIHDVIPPRFLNRVMGREQLQQLSEHILTTMEGEIYIPSDEELRLMLGSDVSKEILGVWRAVADCEYNGKALSALGDTNARNQVLLLVLLRILHLLNADLLLATCTKAR